MSERLPRIDGRALSRALRKAGFVDDRMRGSHLTIVRPSDGRRITVPIHAGRVLPLGTLAAILRDAELSADQLRKLL